MRVFSATAIFLLEVPRVGSPASLASFVSIQRHVACVSKIPMSAKCWSLMPSRCGVSFVL